MKRQDTKAIKIGDRIIGGGSPILIQSMTNTKTADVLATVSQIHELERAGCDIVRVTVPDAESADALCAIVRRINIPLVADIHFDYKLAIKAIENGVDKIRINPGNLGGMDKLKSVVLAAKGRNIPIRVGVNGGSLEKELLEEYGGVCPQALAKSALNNVKMIEESGYDNIVVSVKSSDVLFCVKAYELVAKQCPYPLHIGITEAGTINSGNIKSAIGLGLMLNSGIGDTIRVSLTGDPINEVRSAKIILNTLGLRNKGVEIISCPTCGRTNINVEELALKVEELTKDMDANIKIAVMGCIVNGPGESKNADIGIAGGMGEGLIFKRGQILKKVTQGEMLSALMEEINALVS